MSDWLTEKLLKQIDEQDAEIRRLQAKAKEMHLKLEKGIDLQEIQELRKKLA